MFICLYGLLYVMDIDVGDYLVVKPSLKADTAYVFQIQRINNITDNIDTHIPITTSTPCRSLTSGTVNPPADNVLPAFSLTPPLTFTIPGIGENLIDRNDIFSMRLTAPTYPNILFYYSVRTIPSFIRIIMESPPGTTQRFFQADRVPLNIEGPFGYHRGYVETVQPSMLKYYWVFANDTNLNTHVHIKLKYGEYVIAPVQNPETVFAVLDPIVEDYRSVPVPVQIRKKVKRIQVPLTNLDSQTKTYYQSAYGSFGYPLKYKTYSEAIDIITKETEAMLNVIVR